MVLPVTSGHVSNTSCESCVFCFLFVLVRVVACTVNSACLIINRCETSRFEPMNPAKRPIALPSHTRDVHGVNGCMIGLASEASNQRVKVLQMWAI